MIEQIYQILGYLHGMWRYRWSALAIAWIVAIVGLVVVLKMPDSYQAKAVFHIDTQSILTPLLKGLAIENEEQKADTELMKRVLLSRENLVSVIRENDMDLAVNSPAELDMLASSLARDIQISGGPGPGKKRGGGADIYEIVYVSNSPERVYNVVSTLLDSFIERTLNAGRVDTASAEVFLDKQIAEYEERLTVAEQKLAQFKKQNVGMMPDETGGYYQRLQRSEADAESTRMAIRLAERRLGELRKQLRGEQSVYSTAGTDNRIAEYQKQLELLLTEYTAQHPDVISLKEKIANLSNNKITVDPSSSDDDNVEANPIYQQLKLEESKAKIELETLRLTLADQEGQIKKMRSAIDSIPEVEAELSRLNRDYEVTRKRYLELVQRKESAELAREAEQSTSAIKFRIIDPPIMPSNPVGPNRVMFSLAVFAGALLVGLGWGVLRYLMHPTFIGVKQIKEAFSLPVLGSIGLYISEADMKRRRIQLSLFSAGVLVLASLFAVAILFNDQAVKAVAMLPGI